jgi:hypothetical protein
MSTTALLFSRFVIACLLGAGLGILYDFFACLPRALRHIGDGFFVIALFVCGIYLGFAVCRGDLRTVYSAGLLLGVVGWHYSFGKLLRPLILRLFRLWANIFSKIFKPFKKIFRFIPFFIKKHLHYLKNESTIG